ncbi:MAG: aminotransferase class IV [Rubrivivax sp.]|nr:aminotransferase class IV [Rubrivivax sp.]
MCMTGFSACTTELRRPDARYAPTDAKASCLYANSTRILREARARGFDNAVVCDPDGQVAEFATANLFFVSEAGEIVTPAANGSFLSGITRARVIQLLADDGQPVVERSVQPQELLAAREIFNTGNYAKVTPCTRFLDRELPVGPVARRAHELYLQFMRQT